jgi:beta-N-acetylhexosaminidase
MTGPPPDAAAGGDLARRLVVGLAGPVLHPRERAWLAHWQPAGVLLFARNVRDARQLATLVADLRAVLPAAAELCADHEGGPVSALQAVAGRPPAAGGLGTLDDPDLTTAVHAETAAALREAGLDRVLSPVCDVLSHPRNPVIGARAFGTDAAVVARHAAAAARGLRQGGLRGCAKHWPDHGGSPADTHQASVPPAAAEPAGFLAALDAGLDAVMVGHLPRGHGQPPLSLDRAGLQALRRRLGRGVALWSDDVSMGALRADLAAAGVPAGDGRQEGLADPARLPRAWLAACAAAGCDRLLLRGIPWRALPPPDGAAGPSLPDPAPPQDLACGVPDAPATAAARRRLAAGIALEPGPGRLLWLDTTAGDRLGEAGPALAATVAGAWPDHVRLDTAAPRLAPGPPFARLLVTAQRPLTLAQAQLLEPLTAALGTALVLGHPSLAADVARLAGPGWQVDALPDLAPADLAAVVAAAPGSSRGGKKPPGAD